MPLCCTSWTARLTSTLAPRVLADQDSVQMLQRTSQIGEFYRMSPPAVWDSTKPLPPTYMDITIFDEVRTVQSNPVQQNPSLVALVLLTFVAFVRSY